MEKEYTVEYKAHWSDGVVSEEQIIDVIATTKEEAERIGKDRLNEMDDNDNRHFDCVYRTFYRCVESENFTYLSSAKEDSGIYKDAGYIDVTKYKF